MREASTETAQSQRNQLRVPPTHTFRLSVDTHTKRDHEMWTGHLSRFLSPHPPGPAMQAVNAWLHREPWSSIADSLYWGVVLLFGAPMVGILVLLRLVWVATATAGRLVRGRRQGTSPASAESVTDPQPAVVLTGCDTGFGRDLAARLASDGFVVFAGCLTEDGLSHFRKDIGGGSGSIRPLLLDVTDDGHVKAAAAHVEAWIRPSPAPSDPSSNVEGRPHQVVQRYLHAVVNNAGVGKIGYADWADLSDYTKCMDVNCFGQIRMVKAFLPIFKRQAIEAAVATIEKQRERPLPPLFYPQIMNVTSMAGTVHPTGMALSAYVTSKAAAQAFTDALRPEMKPWGVHVVSVVPSFHRTPLVEDIADRMVHEVWEPLDRTLQEEYGRDFMERHANHVATMMTTQQWDAAVAVDVMARTLRDSSPLCKGDEEPRPPPSRLNLGMDARFSGVLLSMFPAWVQTLVMQASSPDQTPAALRRTVAFRSAAPNGGTSKKMQ